MLDRSIVLSLQMKKKQFLSWHAVLCCVLIQYVCTPNIFSSFSAKFEGRIQQDYESTTMLTTLRLSFELNVNLGMLINSQ